MAPRAGAKKDTPNINKLIADAETQYEVGNLDEAIALASKALELTGEGGDFELKALNLLGVLSVEDGEVEDARDYFLRAVKLDEEGTLDDKIGGGPEKFLFLAQLSEEGGQDSVQWFERGAAALRKQIQALNDATAAGRRTPEQQSRLDELQSKLGGVLCAVAEVYMTDLSWEADAEQRCEALVTEAMLIAPDCAETWQTVANVRISQQRLDEARAALKRSLELWQDLPPEHPSVPEFPTRVSLARLLMETEMEEQALGVLERLVTDDDSSVEVWYLGGWCLYVAGEKLREAAAKPQQQRQQQQQNGEGGEEDAEKEWKATWGYARKWLSQSLKLYELQEYEDDRLGEHARELLESINKELGEPPEGEDDDEWSGISDDEGDEDEDHEHGEDCDHDHEMHD
ncbi:TPR-like protein [Trichoderma citrinoviride]|uniref:TPR-like protein n=1 Tax=Trichoderma citrinoviride TaxID=58853 RepID=A0A2T4BL02_9HYPO|nr:TPR-like protein [Trichoderma citrinoviride]PTB69961.1 TPR-like protein [Trichoderma citrinoviride]